MNFNTIEFLFFFLPATVIAFYIVPVRMRIYVLFLTSLVFYGASGMFPLLLLLLTLVWGYVIANFAPRMPRGPFIIVAISLPLIALWLFKYLRFTLDLVEAGPDARVMFSPFLAIIIPAGISFYTFEVLSYCIDVANVKVNP